MLESLLLSEELPRWPEPKRPERAGLWVVDVRPGSFEFLATFYGDLVLFATSTPVSLASLATLVWDAAATTTHIGRWTLRQVQSKVKDGPPQFGTSDGGADWSRGQIEAMQPVLLALAEAGNGFEFVNTSPMGEVRLTAYPRSELTEE